MTTRWPRRVRTLTMLLLAVAAVVATRRAAAQEIGDDAAAAPAPPVLPRAVPAYRKAETVAVLPVTGAIDGVTLRSLERRIAAARKDGADAIVLEIDTPGGDLLATLDICNLLKSRAETPANVVAWINPQAYSAGTIIALACREIVTTSNVAMGDAAPVQAIPLPQAERAKVESPVLAEVVDSARRQHYDENLVQAFVSVGVELWLIEHARTGERICVDREEYRAVMGEEPPEQRTSVAPRASAGAPAPLVPWFDTTIPRDPSAQAEAMTPEELAREVELQQELPPARERLGTDDRGEWTLVTQIVADDSLLVLRGPEPVYYGLSAATVDTEAQLQAFFGASALTRYDQTWSEGLVRFLVSWPVRILLIVILLVCIFVEMAVPGTGAFGLGAVVTLAVLLGAPYLAGMAQWWEILIIILGFGLIAVEIFLIPGVGVAGLAGALCVLVGLVGTFVSGDLSAPGAMDDVWTGLAATLAAVFAAGVVMWLVSRQIHSNPLLNRIVLKAEVDSSGRGPSLLESMRPAAQPGLEAGAAGVAATDLHPSGRATFDGRLLDVSSVSGYIARGSAVRVVHVGRFVIEVEEAKG